MPLSMMNVGETKSVLHVSGRDKIRKFLESLGFVEGAEVTVVSRINGNLIVHIKETRVAIDGSMANRIIV